MKRSEPSDPFDIFDDDADDAPLAPPAAFSAVPPAVPLLTLVQPFVAQHAPAVSAALRERGDERLASLLSAGARAIADADASCCRAHAEEAAGVGWEALQGAGGWPADAWREAFVLSQLLLCWSDAAADERASALRRLDTALILGGASALLADAMGLLEPARDEQAEAAEAATSADADAPGGPAVAHPIEVSDAIDVEEFGRRFWRPNKPVVVRGAMGGWRGMRRWADLRWLRRAHGERLVPVELGSLRRKLAAGGGAATAAAAAAGSAAATAPGTAAEPAATTAPAGGAGGAAWSERLMRISELIDGYLLPSAESTDGAGASSGGGGGGGGCGGGGVAYLAQHPLFEQLRSLRDDFEVPPYCSLGRLQHVNAWLGTGGTVTPLHFDSYDNLLAQVVGTKYIRLYAPAETPKLYVRGAKAGGLCAQGNVSEVDVEAPDLARHPRFAEAAYEEVTLRPGEMLFIPAHTWHYVRGLSTSWSVSFWF